MINWSNCKPEDFSVSCLVEEIMPVGDRQVFPVSVFHKESEEFAFTKSVPLMAEFYDDLRKTKDWKPALLKILKARVREDIVARINTKKIAVEDKIDLFNEEKETL